MGSGTITASGSFGGVTMRIVCEYVARGDAAALVFEYMAATQAETGQPVPAGISELPAMLQRECRDPPAVYRLPGALLIADHGGQPAGCVGLAPCSDEHSAEIKRLYVRPPTGDKGSPAP